MTHVGSIEVVEIFRVANRLMLKVRMADCAEVRTGDRLELGQSSYLVKAVAFIPAQTWADGIRLLEVDGMLGPTVGACLLVSR